MKNKIFVSRCKSYKKNDVKSVVLEGLNRLGGPGKYINKKQKICVKPNLLLPASPDKAITTHPVFIEAVIEILADHTGKPENIIIADSSAPGVPKARSISNILFSET